MSTLLPLSRRDARASVEMVVLRSVDREYRFATGKVMEIAVPVDE
jgi:hypothetical protein